MKISAKSKSHLKVKSAAVFFVVGLSIQVAYANRVSTPSKPISHCYHWLEESGKGYLTYKYRYAQQKNGELSFYTNGANGAVAGPGIYCAKTPIGSFNYGDRVIRIEFVDDVVLLDAVNGGQTCGKSGNLFPADICSRKSWDLKYYNSSSDWYVIRNPQVIKSWSANSPQLISELQAIKADGGTAADAHMDATISSINSEIARQGGKPTIFFNGNGRMAFADLVKDRQKMNVMPPLSVIAMAVADTSGKVDKATKSDVIRDQFVRALLDTGLEISDFNDVLKQDSSVKRELTSAVESLQDYSNKKALNSVVLVTLIDQLVDTSKLSNAFIKELWVNALVEEGPLFSLVGNPLKKDSVFRKQFSLALPAVDQLVQMIDQKKTSKNLSAVLRLINEYADASITNDYKAYVVEILGRMLKDSGAQYVDDVYSKITNPALQREIALKQVFDNAFKDSFRGIDPIALGRLLDLSSDVITVEEKKVYVTEIRSLPLAVGSPLSYIMLEDYKNGKLKLPSIYTRPFFLSRLVERAISERPNLQSAVSASANAPVKNATNTFRMIAQGLTVFYIQLHDKAKTDAEKVAIAHEASEFFRDLADSLKDGQADAYSYIALQTSGLFTGYKQSRPHPMQAILLDISADKPSASSAASVISKANDGSMLEYLISLGTDATAMKMMQASISHLTTEIPRLLNDPEFLYVQKFEKSKWNNMILGNRYKDKRGRVPADVCYVGRVIETNSSYFNQNFSTDAPTLKKTAAQIKSHSLCKRK